MKSHSRVWAATAGIFAVAVAAAVPSLAQDTNGLVPYGAMMVKVDHVIPGVGTVVIPESSLPQPAGQARTHFQFLIPEAPLTTPFNCLPPSRTCETPASLACIYRLVPQSNGCNPNIVTTLSSGGHKAIGIVDAFHDQTALSDLQTFSTTFGLPAPDLEVVYCSATSCTNVTTPPPACQTSSQCGWAHEESLDLQAAHSMAPHAKIFLVEAYSNSIADLLLAEEKAAQLVAGAGGGEVSNSWGGQDSSRDRSRDSHFVKSGVVFFASTGDHKNGGDPPYVADIEYPSVSPDVVAVGGTQIVRGSNGSFMYESAWDNGGGGLSTGETRPSYQNVVKNKVGSRRGVPDVAADAAPESGLLVYCTPSSCGTESAFVITGGTSLAAPLVAAMSNAAGHFRRSSASQLGVIYRDLNGSEYNAISHGTCHNGPGASAVTLNATSGWNVCTGVGTPHGLSGL